MNDPFTRRVAITRRLHNLVEFEIHSRPGTTAYRLWVSTTPTSAYGTMATSGIAGDGGAMKMEIPAGGFRRSPSIEARGITIPGGSAPGQTTAIIDPEDWGINDDRIWYVRVQECRGGTWQAADGAAPKNPAMPLLGAVCIVMPAIYYTMSSYVVSMQIPAPAKTGCVLGDVPQFDSALQTPTPFVLVLPKGANTVTVTNTSDATALWVGYGAGLPMSMVRAGDTSLPTGGGFSQPGVREIYLATDPAAAAPVSVALEMTLSNERA